MHKLAKVEYEETYGRYLDALERSLRPDVYFSNNTLEFISDPIAFYNDYAVALQEVSSAYNVTLGTNLSTRAWSLVALIFNYDYQELYQDLITEFSVESENLNTTLTKEMTSIMNQNKYLLYQNQSDEGH